LSKFAENIPGGGRAKIKKEQKPISPLEEATSKQASVLRNDFFINYYCKVFSF